MATTASASPMDASAVALDCRTLKDTTAPPGKPRYGIDPVDEFGVDYNDCNCILSAMTPSPAVAQSSYQPNKPKATLSQKKDGPSSIWHKKTTAPTSSPQRVIYATALLAELFLSSETMVPTPPLSKSKRPYHHRCVSPWRSAQSHCAGRKEEEGQHHSIYGVCSKD